MNISGGKIHSKTLIKHLGERYLFSILFLGNVTSRDPRPAIQSAWHTTRAFGKSYEESIEMILRCTDDLDDDDETHRMAVVTSHDVNAVLNDDWKNNISNSSNQTNHQYNAPQQGTSYAGGKAYAANDFRSNYNDPNKQTGIRYCYKWAKGNCSREDCPFVHEFDPKKVDNRLSSQNKNPKKYGPKSAYNISKEKKRKQTK